MRWDMKWYDDVIWKKKLKVAVANIFQIKKIQYNNSIRLATKNIKPVKISKKKKIAFNFFNFVKSINLNVKSWKFTTLQCRILLSIELHTQFIKFF